MQSEKVPGNRAVRQHHRRPRRTPLGSAERTPLDRDAFLERRIMRLVRQATHTSHGVQHASWERENGVSHSGLGSRCWRSTFALATTLGCHRNSMGPRDTSKAIFSEMGSALFCRTSDTQTLKLCLCVCAWRRTHCAPHEVTLGTHQNCANSVRSANVTQRAVRAVQLTSAPRCTTLKDALSLPFRPLNPAIPSVTAQHMETITAAKLGLAEPDRQHGETRRKHGEKRDTHNGTRTTGNGRGTDTGRFFPKEGTTKPTLHQASVSFQGGYIERSRDRFTLTCD